MPPDRHLPWEHTDGVVDRHARRARCAAIARAVRALASRILVSYGGSSESSPAVLLFDTESPPHMTTSTDEVARRKSGAAGAFAVRPPDLPDERTYRGERTGVPSMATGAIKRLERERGFGFIRPAGASEDLFFHSSTLEGLVFDELREGQAVEFEQAADERDPRRTRAVRVRAEHRSDPMIHRAPAK